MVLSTTDILFCTTKHIREKLIIKKKGEDVGQWLGSIFQLFGWRQMSTCMKEVEFK